MSLAGAASTGFSGGRVFTRTVEAIQANLMEFGKVGLALFAAPSLILGLLGLPLRQAAIAEGGFGALGAAQFAAAGPLGLMGLIGAACGLIGSAGMIWGYWAHTGGQRPSFAEMIRKGTSNALPVLLTGFLMGLGILFGFMLLFVPGVILGVMWCVAIPSQVVERPDGLGAFARSRALTRGNRWAIFGMFLLYFLALWGISLLIGLVVGIGAGVSALTGSALLGSPFALAGVLLSAAESGVFGVFGAVFASALYYELRSVKEGLAPESLARVFE